MVYAAKYDISVVTGVVSVPLTRDQTDVVVFSGSYLENIFLILDMVHLL